MFVHIGAWILDNLSFVCIPYNTWTKLRIAGLYYYMLLKNLFGGFWQAKESFLGYRVSAARYKYIFGIFTIAFFKWQYFFTTKNPKPLIIDCGANIGVTSLFFDFLYPNAEIHTFEPNPTVYHYLEQNTKSQKNIINNQIAVSDQEGTLDFFIVHGVWDTFASLYDTTNKVEWETIQVAVRKLSGYLQNELQGRKVDCIKFNIEGAEDGVIEDLAAADCLKNIDHMIFEYHHHIERGVWSKLARLLQRLEEHGMNYTFSVTNFRLYKEDISQNIFIHAYRKVS